MSQELTLLFQYAGFFSLAILILLILCAWIFGRIDWPFEPSPEEISRRQAEAAAKQATKEFNRRRRMRVVRSGTFNHWRKS